MPKSFRQGSIFGEILHCANYAFVMQIHHLNGMSLNPSTVWGRSTKCNASWWGRVLMMSSEVIVLNIEYAHSIENYFINEMQINYAEMIESEG